LRCPSPLMVSRPLSQKPTPESGGRSRRCRSPASIAERSVAPSASAPISVIAGFIQSLERPRSARPPVGAGAGGPAVGASASQPRVGAAAGEVGAEVGAGIALSTAVPDHSVAAAWVGAAAGEPPVGAAAGVGVDGSGDRRAYPYLSGTPGNAKGCQF